MLMLSCWASLCVGATAAPGDCTPIEAASYLIDPRTRTVTSPAVCEADPSFNASADCERRNVPPIGPEYARSTATRDACYREIETIPLSLPLGHRGSSCGIVSTVAARV